MTATDRLAELGDLVLHRREQLGLTMDQVASVAGIARTTQWNIEKGKRVRGLSYARLEPVLGWASGACRLYLSTGEPPVASAPAAAEPEPSKAVIADGTPEESIESVRRWAETDTGMTDEQREEILVLVRLTEERIRDRKPKRRRRPA